MALSILLVVTAIFVHHKKWNLSIIAVFSVIAIGSFLLEVAGVATGTIFRFNSSIQHIIYTMIKANRTWLGVRLVDGFLAAKLSMTVFHSFILPKINALYIWLFSDWALIERDALIKNKTMNTAFICIALHNEKWEDGQMST